MESNNSNNYPVMTPYSSVPPNRNNTIGNTNAPCNVAMPYGNSSNVYALPVTCVPPTMPYGNSSNGYILPVTCLPPTMPYGNSSNGYILPVTCLPQITYNNDINTCYGLNLNDNNNVLNNSKIYNGETTNALNCEFYNDNEINGRDNLNYINAVNNHNAFRRTDDSILDTDYNCLNNPNSFNDVNTSSNYDEPHNLGVIDAAPFDGNNTTSINNSTNYPNSNTINFNSFNDVNTSVHNNNKASSGVKIINNKLNDDNRDIENIINCIEKFNETNLLKEFYKPKNDELIRFIKLYGKKEKEENINNNKAIKDDVNKIPKKVVGKSEISIKARKKDLNNFFENKIQFFSYIFYNNESGKGCSNNDRHKKCEEIIVNEDNIIKAIINYDLP